MTWRYEIDGDTGELRVFDHTGSEVASATAGPSGITIPDDVLDVMRAEVEAEGLSGGLTQRQVAILADAVFEDIERGAP